MDFTTLQTRVAEEAGLDLTDVDDLASIKSWINQTYQSVSGLYEWDWLFTQGTIQTVPDISSGTATVSGYGTSVALSAAPTVAGAAVSVANQWMINFPSVSQDWYIVSTHTSGSTALTISVPLVSSSTLTGGSYVLRKVYYTLPTNLDKIIDIRQQISSVKLMPVDARSFDRLLPNPTSVGNPIYYSFIGRDTSATANWQISLFPIPSAILNLQVKYYRTTTELSNSTDIPIMPVNFHDVLIYGAMYLFGHPFIDDDRWESAGVRFKEKLKEMKENCDHFPDNLTVVQPWDSRPTFTLRRPRLPSNYPDYINGL